MYHQTTLKLISRLRAKLQRSQKQSETHDLDAFVSWQFLMREWAVAYARCRAAIQARARIEALPGSVDEREAGEATALVELTEIKQQIDQLISESSSRRSPIVGSIIVGIIETSGFHSDRAANEANAVSDTFT